MRIEYRVETARSGVPTVYADGRALHSRFDPQKEARQLASRVPDSAAIVVLGGYGLGYVAEALLEAAPGRRLVIAEADPSLIDLAGRHRRSDAVLSSPSVTLLAGGDAKDVGGLLKGGPPGAEIFYVGWKPSAALHPEWYGELEAAVADTSRRREVNARTLERFGPLWVRNLAANAGTLVRAASLEPWKDRFLGIPALVVAGGPSLEDVLPYLKTIAETHLIISVDTAVPAVLRSGAKPDIIAAVDPQYWNTRHLDRCGEGTEDTLVLAESATHPSVFRKLPGKPWLTRTRFPLGSVLEDAAGIAGELKAGGSVATAGWDLARHLGCSPLSIAGLDLGFPGGRTHYSGSLSRELPLKDSCRTSPAEDRFYHALHDAGARPVEAMDGGRVLSDARMDVYAAWFAESAAALADRRPAVVGSKGRRISGMGIVTVEELTSLPVVTREKRKLLEEVMSTPGKATAEKDVAKALEDMVESLDFLESTALEGLEITGRAMERMAAGESISEAMADLDRIDKLILGESGRELVSFLIQPIILEISSGRNGKDDPLETSRRLYREMADSASYHIRHLRRATGR